MSMIIYQDSTDTVESVELIFNSSYVFFSIFQGHGERRHPAGHCAVQSLGSLGSLGQRRGSWPAAAENHRKTIGKWWFNGI